MASGDDSWVPPGARDDKGRHLRGVGEPARDAVVLSFTDAVQQRRSPRVIPDEDATTAPNGWPALGGHGPARRRLSVVGDDNGADNSAGSAPSGLDDGPDIA